MNKKIAAVLVSVLIGAGLYGWLKGESPPRL